MRASENIYVGESKIPTWVKFFIMWNVIVISICAIVYEIAPVNLFQCIKGDSPVKAIWMTSQKMCKSLYDIQQEINCRFIKFE